MRIWILTLAAAVTLIAAAPAKADGAVGSNAEAAAAQNYLNWLEERRLLWPQEISALEKSPVSSAQEIAQLKELMGKVEQEARALAAGRQLSQSPIQLHVLTIETELEHLAGEADRLPILAGNNDD